MRMRLIVCRCSVNRNADCHYSDSEFQSNGVLEVLCCLRFTVYWNKLIQLGVLPVFKVDSQLRAMRFALSVNPASRILTICNLRVTERTYDKASRSRRDNDCEAVV